MSGLFAAIALRRLTLVIVAGVSLVPCARDSEPACPWTQLCALTELRLCGGTEVSFSFEGQAPAEVCAVVASAIALHMQQAVWRKSNVSSMCRLVFQHWIMLLKHRPLQKVSAATASEICCDHSDNVQHLTKPRQAGRCTCTHQMHVHSPDAQFATARRI